MVVFDIVGEHSSGFCNFYVEFEQRNMAVKGYKRECDKKKNLHNRGAVSCGCNLRIYMNFTLLAIDSQELCRIQSLKKKIVIG